MQWMLANTTSGTPLNETRYLSEKNAQIDLSRLGEVFSNLYQAIPDYTDGRWRNILTEGLKRGDLEGILLPQFSVDVYVPGDASTDNIVVGFLIKGVPEAVFPFKNFCLYCRGVKKVDYGDSDTMPHTSIVYVEFDREQFDVRDFGELIDGVCRLGSLDPDDLSVSFPNSNKVYPYSLEKIQKYFSRRNIDRNRLEQWKANKERADTIQQEIEHEMSQGSIGQRLGNQTGNKSNNPQNFHYLKHPNRLTKLRGQEKDIAKFDVPETVKASIIADAQRNRASHQSTWEEFDKRWSMRLRTKPGKIASIRKQIYRLNNT